MPVIPLPDHPVVALRKSLLANGFQPVAVYTGQKRPYGYGWQARRGLPQFHPEAMNTGILCHNVRAIDIDIDDPDEAERVVKLTEAFYGPSPLHRVRSTSPRRLLLYRGEGDKRILKLPKGKVEILGKGQQFVAYGTHPDGSRYEWRGLDPTSYSLK